MTIRLTVTNTETEEEKVAVLTDIDPAGNRYNKRVLHPGETKDIYIHSAQFVQIAEGI